MVGGSGWDVSLTAAELSDFILVGPESGLSRAHQLAHDRLMVRIRLGARELSELLGFIILVRLQCPT